MWGTKEPIGSRDVFSNNFRQMLYSAPGALVKDSNIVSFFWKWCSQCNKSSNFGIFNAKTFIFFLFLVP
jgi:hypothetical protein